MTNQIYYQHETHLTVAICIFSQPAVCSQLLLNFWFTYKIFELAIASTLQYFSFSVKAVIMWYHHKSSQNLQYQIVSWYNKTDNLKYWWQSVDHSRYSNTLEVISAIPSKDETTGLAGDEWGDGSMERKTHTPLTQLHTDSCRAPHMSTHIQHTKH